jgi:uncharacterized membrane protein YkvA (DUF1232 family)
VTSPTDPDMEKHYTDDGFWHKVRRVAKVIGREATEKALVLYFAMQDPEVPAWAKRVAVGALAYLILPIDVIPDLLLPFGLTDDIGVMAVALTQIAIHVSAATKTKAADKASEWFGK